MKTVILAGGMGARLAEETSTRPKPMVEIGGRPILWHIMKIYSAYGFGDFVIACGYKGEMIKEYFYNYYVRNNDYFVDLRDGTQQIHKANGDDWRVGVIDTGIKTNTGGRILRLRKWIGNGTFMLTYGDGVGNINIKALVEFHRRHGKKASVTAVRPPARFGGLELDGEIVKEFSEKPQTGEGWINGGFFIFESSIFDYLTGDDSILEREPLEKLAKEGELCAFRHEGFWHPMDTLRDKYLLEEYWAQGNAPWKVWS